MFEVAEGKSVELFRIFKMLVNKEVPKSRFDPIYKYSGINFIGSSFLLHPDVLLYNAYKHSTRDIVIYISMASLRPFSEYLANRTLSLELVKAPVNPQEYLDDPTFIPIENGVLRFIYEESPDTSLQH